MRIEAAVEAHHEGRLGVTHNLETGLHAVKVQINRLFTENRLPGPGKPFDQVCMRVGRGADHHRVNIRSRKDVVDAADGTAILICNRLRGGGKGIGHGHKPGIAVSGDRLCVDLADAPCAKKSEPDRHAVLIAGPTAPVGWWAGSGCGVTAPEPIRKKPATKGGLQGRAGPAGPQAAAASSAAVRALSAAPFAFGSRSTNSMIAIGAMSP